MALRTIFSANKTDLIEPSSVTRLLVISYFLALSLGLVHGSDVRLLATPFMPENVAHYLMRAVVLLLGAMVLFGVQRKAAALILSLVIFWPSYMTLYGGGDVSAFWRDLALIGALVMSATQRSAPEQEVNEVHGVEDHTLGLEVTIPADAPKDANVYREDLNLARSA